MALQKILYFADGKYLAARRRPLFDSRIEAWDYGPVVPDVYHEFKRFSSSPITEKASILEADGDVRYWRWVTPDLPLVPETASDRAFLDKIWSEYGRRSAVDLMRESHEPKGPWAEVYARWGRHIEIPPETMLAYFSQHG